MDQLLASKRTLQSKTKRLESTVADQADVFQDPTTCKVYIERANELLKTCDDLLDSISLQIKDEEEFKKYEEDLSNTSSVLEKLKLRLMKSSQAPQQVTDSKALNVEVRLPKLELPVFDGNLDEWLSFRDLFVAAVHDNANLTGAQKLQYLKASLKGDASVLLQSVSITNDNYGQAWELLNSRYQNRREIVTSTLKRLLSHPSMDCESPAKLRKLVDNTMECSRSLKVMNVPVEHWDVIMSHLLVDKLDQSSKEQWELSIETGEIPALKDLLEFLDKRSRALSNITATQRKKNPTGRWNMPYPPPGPSTNCPSCNGRHPLHQCSRFIHMPLTQKEEFLSDKSLCKNCLRPGHTLEECNAGGCHVCGQRHHTVVCSNRCQN